jgi:hypothetical protein
MTRCSGIANFAAHRSVFALDSLSGSCLYQRHVGAEHREGHATSSQKYTWLFQALGCCSLVQKGVVLSLYSSHWLHHCVNISSTQHAKQAEEHGHRPYVTTCNTT